MRRRLPLVFLIVACVGFFAAGVLGLAHALDLPIPCGESSGCMTVAAHPVSRIAGVPIAYLGAAAYTALIALFLRAPRSEWALRVLTVAAGVGTAVSAGLLLYAEIEIEATCVWCIVSGAAMLALFTLARRLRRLPPAALRVRPLHVWCLVYATGIAVGAQAGLMLRNANAPPVADERLGDVPASAFDDPAKSLGRPDAPVTIVMFTDLWCPGCRASHASLMEFRDKSPDGVRIVLRHRTLRNLPGHESSWETAILSEIAAENGRFEEFIAAIYAQERVLNVEECLAVIARLGLDADAARERLTDTEDPAVERVRTDEQLAWRLGIHDTPTYVVLAGDDAPVSASIRTLPDVLNSPSVQAFLSWAERVGPSEGGSEPR